MTRVPDIPNNQRALGCGRARSWRLQADREPAARSHRGGTGSLSHSPIHRDCASRRQERCHSLSTGDTDIGPRSFEVALHGAGTCLNAIDLVMAGKAKNAFCIVRPPGHHASADRSMGFFASLTTLRSRPVMRNAATEWSASPSPTGTCTTAMVRRTSSTPIPPYSFSAHTSLPGIRSTGAASETGAGAGGGNNSPIALFPRAPAATMSSALSAIGFVPRMDEFRPDLILISAGFDSRIGDPLGRFRIDRCRLQRHDSSRVGDRAQACLADG